MSLKDSINFKENNLYKDMDFENKEEKRNEINDAKKNIDNQIFNFIYR